MGFLANGTGTQKYGKRKPRVIPLKGLGSYGPTAAVSITQPIAIHGLSSFMSTFPMKQNTWRKMCVARRRAVTISQTCLVKTGSHYVPHIGPELLNSSDPPTLVS